MLTHIHQNLPGLVRHSPQIKLFRHSKENVCLRHGLNLAAGPVVLLHQEVVNSIKASMFFIALLYCQMVAKNRQRIAYTGLFQHFAVKVTVIGFAVHVRLQCALGGNLQNGGRYNCQKSERPASTGLSRTFHHYDEVLNVHC